MTDFGNASEQEPNALGVQEQESAATNENGGNAGDVSGEPQSGAEAPASTAAPDASAAESAGSPDTPTADPQTESPQESPSPASAPSEPAAPAQPADPAPAEPAPAEPAAPAAEPAPAEAPAEPAASADAGEGEQTRTEGGGDAASGDESTDATTDGSGEFRGGRGGRRAPKLSEEQMRELWTELAGKRDSSEEIELEIISQNRGGVVAQYKGLEVFIPMSHWSLDKHTQGVASDAKTGDAITANVLEMTEFETDARRVTATRRAILRKGLLESLEVGKRLKGKVTSILDFGIFVDLGGIDGLVHASEISHAHAKHPGEQVQKGQEVDVIIREIDRDKKRIYLGMKELLPSPWDNVEEKYPIGSTQHGKVVGLSKTGAFIELEPGVDGFVRLRELSWTKRVHHPKEVLKKGVDIDVKVLDASNRKQRLSLSYRQAQDDPWPALVEKYALGTRWEGEVREISNKGVVVAVGEIEGFLPRGRMGREAKRLPEMKMGEKLNVHVVDVDPKGLSVIFGLSTQDGDEGGERNERGGRGRGERGDHGEGGRGDRRERTAPPTQPENELKTAGNVGSFSIGDMIGEALRKKLNYENEGEEKKKGNRPEAAPAPAPQAAAAPEAPAAEAAPAEAPAAEAAPAEAPAAEAPATEAPAAEAPAADETASAEAPATEPAAEAGEAPAGDAGESGEASGSTDETTPA